MPSRRHLSHKRTCSLSPPSPPLKLGAFFIRGLKQSFTTEMAQELGRCFSENDSKVN